MSEHDELNQLLAGSSPTSYARPAKSRGRSGIEESGEGKDVGPRNFTQWATSDKIIFTPASMTQVAITPGVYEIGASPEIGLYFKKIPVKTEGLLKFPDSNSDKVVSEISKFWERADLFDKYGLSFKRGILLYGPPGSGKSCTIQLIMKDVISKGGIAVSFTEPHLFIQGLRVLRQIQPKCPVVTIMEDVESILENYSESEILNILDGVNNVDYTVFLATTNYPQRLGARIVNRPSRFDKRFRISHPKAEARKMYFEHLVADCKDDDLSPEERMKHLGIDLERWVKDTAEMSLAHLKELFIAVVILGDDYKDAINALSSMKEAIDDREYGSKMGLKGGH